MDKKDLRIVFFGTPDFAVASLKAIVSAGYQVVAVVTAPDKAAGRGYQLQSSAVKKAALELGLEILQPEKLKSPEFVETLRALRADLQIVIAFRMLPEMVWNMPPMGTFNLHASVLPKYRGAAPINHAIINGETSTGNTTFFLKHEIDTGAIILQDEVSILPEDNAGTLHDKLMDNGAEILKDANKITENEYKSFIESLPSRTLVFTNDEGTIDANGKWNPVNKLNTSYSDIADLISTILITDKENGNEIANELINVINTQGDVKQVLLKNKTNIKVLFNNYIESPKDILSFTKNVIKNSKSGEKIENNVATRLSNMGYTILYRGGDGDFVDMIFSIDMIIQSPKSGVRTIQIKSNEYQAIKFKDEFDNEGKHQTVDLLIYPLGDKYVIDSLRTNKTKTIPKLINP